MDNIRDFQIDYPKKPIAETHEEAYKMKELLVNILSLMRQDMEFYFDRANMPDIDPEIIRGYMIAHNALGRASGTISEWFFNQ